MKAERPGEIIHMTYINTTTKMDGRVAILISVDNYSGYCFGIAVEKGIMLPEMKKHINGIMDEVNKRHPLIQPLFVIAYGKEMIPELEKEFMNKATFLFNPTLADKFAMPAAKALMDKLFKR